MAYKIEYNSIIEMHAKLPDRRIALRQYKKRQN